jgi:hypothetical protein
MDQPVNPDERDPAVTTVAAISLVAGLACPVAPATTARLAGIDATPGVVRAVGLADLALALGLSGGRPGHGCWPAPPRTRPSPPCRWRQSDHDAPVCSLPALQSPRAPTCGPSPGSAPPLADRHATQRPSALALRVLIDTQLCHRRCDGQEWRDTGTRKLIGRRCLRPIGRSQGRSRNSSRRSLEPVVIAEGARATCAPTDRRDLTVP